jgi:Ca2+-binding EF-hand superfamily protein
MVSGGIAFNYEITCVDGMLTVLPTGDEGADKANTLSLENLTANKNTQVVLPIAMKNEESITGFQFDLCLPEGVTVATTNKGKMLISTTSRMEGNYIVSSNVVDDCVRVIGYSADGDAFTGNTGIILEVTLNIGDEIANGNYMIRLRDIVLSDVSGTDYYPADAGAVLTVKDYTLADVDNSGAININDVVCIINHILNKPNVAFIAGAADVDGNGAININDVVTLINRYILKREAAAARLASPRAIDNDNYLHLANIDIKPGETKSITMLLTNTSEVSAVQGNIKLPEGVSFVTKANGRLDVSNIDGRSEDFTLSCALQADGSMTFAHYSADGFAYEGNEGGIFTFKIKADYNAEPGTYNVKLSEVVLSINGIGYDIDDRTSQLNVIDKLSKCDVNGDGKVDVADITAIISEMAAQTRIQHETEK